MEDIEFIKSLVAIGGVPFITAVVQVIKTFIKDHRLYPVTAIGIGLVINLMATWILGNISIPNWFVAVIYGFIAGMAASGLYSSGMEIIPEKSRNAIRQTFDSEKNKEVQDEP